MVSLFMAWSPVWRFNTRINWVGQPGDCANLIPTTPATAPGGQCRQTASDVMPGGPLAVGGPRKHLACRSQTGGTGVAKGYLTQRLQGPPAPSRIILCHRRSPTSPGHPFIAAFSATASSGCSRSKATNLQSKNSMSIRLLLPNRHRRGSHQRRKALPFCSD